MPGPWSYETRTERTTRLARVQAQPKDYGSQLDSFLSDRLNKIGIDPGVLASAPPQPAQQAPASATPPTTDRRILQQSADKRAQIAGGLTTPQGDSGGGFLSDFASGVKDVAAGALHAGLSVAAKPFELSSQYGSPVFSALTGESRAGRHPILDANGQPTGQFYRDKPDFRDMGASLLGLVTNPVSEYQRGQGAVNERINNPQVQKDFVGRGALRTFSDPLQVGIAALSGGSTALAAPAFNIATEGATQYAQDLPGWRNLSPDVQQALILAGSVIAAKKGPAIAKKAAELTGLKDAYQMGAVPGAAMVQTSPLGNIDTNPVPEAPKPGMPPLGNANEPPISSPVSPPNTAAGSAPEVATPESAPPLAPASDGGSAPPPGSIPPGPPEPPSGGITPGGPDAPLPTVQVGPFTLPDITPTPLNRVDRTMNAIKRTLGVGVEEDPMASPAMRARKQAQPVIDAQAARLGAVAQTLVDGAFKLDDKGRVADLVGNPTIADVAARLPEFQPFLTPQQLQVMEQLRAEVQPYHDLLSKVGVDVNSRADVQPGGFYLPRGRADIEGADLPIKVGSGRSGGVGGRKSFEKGAVFHSQAQGIDAGYQYAPLNEALQSYARDAGNRIFDQHVANYFKTVTDENGVPVGETFAERVPPAMRTKVDALRGQIDSMRGKLATAERRAGIATGQADALASPLERLQSGITDRATARAALRDAQAELRLERRQALSASRDAGSAATKDSITRSKFKAAQSRADNALAKLQVVRQQLDEAQGIKTEQKGRIGLGEVAPTGFGVRLPALNETVLQAVKDAADARQELRQLTGRTAMPIGAEAASNTTMLRRGIAEARSRAGAEGLRTAEQGAVNSAKDLAPETVFTTMRQMDARVAALKARGAKWSGLADSINQQLDTTRQAYEQFLPEWQRALDRARQTPREQGTIGIAQLNGMTFPDVVANAANKYLAAERPPSGQGAAVLRTVNGVNNLLRGLRASFDASFMGIQGLLGAGRDPVGYGKALSIAYKAIADPQALGKYLVEYDRKAVASGLPTSKQLISNGLHIGGADTEFAAGKGLPLIGEAIQKGSVPKTGLNPIRGSNRMFGYFGDTLRLELAQTAFENAKRGGFDMADSANLRAVSNAANLATGWSPNTFGGDVGKLAEFAPRFLQSQLELVTKAATDGSITGNEARIALSRTIGMGTLLTVAANEASGRPIDYKELLDPNSPNFMRIRVAGQDISLFGPWDSLTKAVVNLGHGDVGYFARSKASPTVSLAWDLLSGSTFMGDTAALNNPGYLIRQLLPFSVQDIGRQPWQQTAIGMSGVKSSPLSPTEAMDQIAQAKYGKGFYDLLSSQQAQLKADHPDTWQRMVERGNSNRQKYEAIKGQFTTQQQAADTQLLSGKMTREDWLKQYDDRKTQLAGAQLAIYGKDTPITNPRNASERYAQILQQNRDETGAYNWDAIDAAVVGLKPEDQAWIQDRQGLGNTPVVTAYKQAAGLRSKYFDLPKYKGFTGSEAQQIDGLWTQLRANVRVPNTGPMLSELKKLNADGSIDPKIYSGVRRRILGVLRTTKDRERFVKANPSMATFFGGNGKGGPLTASEAQQLQGAA